MNLEGLSTKVGAFINESVESMQGYSTVEQEYQTKVREGLKGHVEAENQLKEMQEAINQKLSTEAAGLKEAMQAFEEQELQRIEESSDPITADQLAELTLLSELELTSGDLDKYAEKYKRNPLALRKLQGIARERTLMANFPQSREDVLKSVLGRLDTQVNQFSTLKTGEVELLKQKFRADGAIEGIQDDVRYYGSL